MSIENTRTMDPADLALSFRHCGDTITIGGLDGLLALAGARVLSLRSEPSRTRPGHTWVSLVEFPVRVVEGSGETIALALVAACEAAASCE